MPIIYLSPSTQDWNHYVNGGTEEEWMNLLADKMAPMLDASGIRYARNTPDMTAASSIAASNAGDYDFHLALHSNAAAGAQAGKVRGSIVFYYPGSADGRQAGGGAHRRRIENHLPRPQQGAHRGHHHPGGGGPGEGPRRPH